MEAVDSHDAKTCVYFLRVLSPAAEVQEGLGRDPQSWYLRTGVLVCWGGQGLGLPILEWGRGPDGRISVRRGPSEPGGFRNLWRC